ncbi:ERF family protein [Microbacterium telephonicum]|uniref:ERF superfamily protein n=1 Tax=Microbacterium telephonicum TaxID=1714841 RepID=A0A498BXL9_9MICO|nr:ERF family protein [Microbacterium telephonicum]RLK47647.1 ERF superfamily protein [Microbacterium telephonicum]
MTDHKSLTAALVAFQAELPDVSKGGTNPAFKSKYATLPDITKAVFPVASKHGLAFVTYPDETEHGPVLRYELRHTSGEQISGAFGLPDGAKAQEYGSWITYFRRYILSAITGITPDEDDDGNAASTPRVRQQRQTQDTVAAAVTAIDAAATPEALDSLAQLAKQRGIDGVATVRTAIEKRRATLGHSASVEDAWAAVPVAEVPK